MRTCFYHARRRLIMAAGAFLLAYCPLATGAARAESLEARLNALLADPQLKTAQIGVDVEELTAHGPAVIFSHNAAVPLEPASNCKILTTAAAFEKYGPGASFKTTLFSVGPDLLLVGGGDPGLGDAKIAAAAGQTPTSVFEEWAQTLQRAGITHYRQLLVDDRVFDSQWIHPDWPANELLSDDYAAIGGLNFNANCLDWTPKLTPRGIAVDLVPDTSYVSVVIKAQRAGSGGKESRVSMIRPATSNHFEMRGTLAASAGAAYSVPIYDPGLWTGTVLHDVLERAGISSQAPDAVRRVAADEHFSTSGADGPPAHLLASHATPLLAVIKRANTNSLNMMAECLCKRLGYDATGRPGSWSNGTAAVEAYAAALGANREWVDLADGSGLSHKNKVAPRVFTTVLAHIADRPDGQQFIETLAIPRKDGTLDNRFKGMAVAEHLRAKTGHINGVSSLSGYITVGGAAGQAGRDTGATRRIVFSILVNKKPGPVDAWQDQVCEAIYQWALGK